jgi:glycine cleavage system aminomethyltransferase T
VTRLADDEFLIITGHPSQVRDRAWFRAHIPGDWRVQCHDVTANHAMFALSGPRSREIVQALSDADLSNEALGFGHAQWVDIGCARAWILRRSFVGELGYEIYPTTDLARHVYEELLRVGAPLGLRHAGFFAMNHCRLEAGFVHFSHDVAEDDTPFEAGLKFAVALEKESDFIGRDALRRKLAAGPIENRLVNVKLAHASLDRGPYLLRNEPIWRGDELVGYVTSGGWGFRVNASLGMAYVRKAGGVTADWLVQGGFRVEIAGDQHEIDLQFASFYDPKKERLRS